MIVRRQPFRGGGKLDVLDLGLVTSRARLFCFFVAADEGEWGERRTRREREGLVEIEVLVLRDLEFKMKPQWGADQDMFELGWGNACIVDSAVSSSMSIIVIAQWLFSSNLRGTRACL